MAKYERINVREEWYDQVSKYLEENPEEGFEPDEVKDFIKFVINKYMNGALGVKESEVLETLEKIVKEN